MLSNNVFMKNKSKIKRIITILVVLNILIYCILGVISTNNTYAAQTKENVSSKLSKYPGYTELINKLRQEHPKWNFTILYTGLDWNQVIKNETTAWHGRNLITSSKKGDWVCPTCGNTKYDTGSWKCASESTVSYYMDPRNFLYTDYIFQFEDLSYNGDIQNISGVEQIIKDVKYMQGTKITYTKTDGKTGTINKSYAQVIMEAAKEAGISPYHLASRIRQEQGTGTTPGSTATGTYTGYVGYYNFLNINASGSGAASVIQRGLQYAKNNGLDDPQKSITAGAKFLAQSYIGKGQSTLYLQKFDVDSQDGSLYMHQYMQNVQAAVNEGISVKNSYNSMGMLNSSINFIIPVYENMPADNAPMPGTQGFVTQNVKIVGNSINIRKSKNTDSEVIAKLNNGDKILRIEISYAKENGYNWDKVVLANGAKGYVATEYLEQINDITNCNDSVIANTSVNLRNGPGTTGTSIITTLIEGQSLTRIETGKYNGVDGYNWDRVKLSDGRQGYLVSSYIDKAGTTTNPGNTTNNSKELVKVTCGSGLKVRESPSTSASVLTYLSNNEVVTRTQANVSNANGYTWDKIVTGSGVTGYIARGNTNETYIQVIGGANTGGENTGGKNTDGTTNNKFKIEENVKQVITEPETKAKDIKSKYSNAVIKNGEKSVDDNDFVGTSYTITIDSKIYTIVKIGDTSGDGIVDIIDMALIKRHLMGTNKLSGVYQKAGQIDSKSNEIDIIDMALIKRHIDKSQKITL